MELTLTKTKTFSFHPVPTKGFSWKPRKDKIHLGSIRFYNHSTEVWPLSESERKQLIAFMKKTKTDVLTDRRYFYTTVNDGLVRIEHPEFVMPEL